ncbi:uncharacterized protein METZ01_LOCUS511852, partial [marine metagenome]
SHDNDEYQCSFDDADNCDDCSSGSYNTSDDGWDYDTDGLCDDGDLDDDNDGALDDVDSDDNNEFECSYDDADNCDDCSSGSYDPSNDGADNDTDGLCDDGDPDDDNDGCLDTDDDAPFTWSHDEDEDGEGADCDETPYGEISLSFANGTETSIDILYTSSVAIGGYQFAVSGVNLTAAYDTFDMIAFNWENGMVFGTDMGGYDLPSGESTLLHLEFEAVDGGSTISLSEL